MAKEYDKIEKGNKSDELKEKEYVEKNTTE
jgi:hypothetical protein